MLLSNTCIYGLRASVLLASKEGDKFVTIRELSDELHISFHFLTKVLQQLTKSELLQSYKGPNGGVKLARPASQITFMDVVISIDGENIIKECALGLPGCGELKPCPLHDQWSAMKENILRMMRDVSLKQLAANKNSDPLKQLASVHALKK
ncbi:MAG: Rrf2 family transcriptional regulator [Balneolaceae bacterium]|nr:Rrf2 family transcriptional regulator [Balneolaceae bacterium]